MISQIFSSRFWRALSIFGLATGLVIVGQGERQVAADHIVEFSTDAHPYDFTFSTTGQSMWGPGEELSPGVISLEIISPSDLFWDVSLNPREVDDLGTGEYGIGIDAGTEGSAGLSTQFTVGAGSVGVDAPMSLTLDVPTSGSFKPGDVISITSSASVLNPVDAKISAVAPSAEVGIVVDYDVAAFLEAELCVGDCYFLDLVEPVDESGTLDLMTPVDVSDVEINSISAAITGVSGTYGVPDPTYTSTVSGGTISATGTDADHIDLEVDLDTWFSRFTPVPPLGRSVPDFGTGFSGKYEILDVDLEITVSQEQDFTFTPGTVGVALAFPVPVIYSVYEGATLIDSGTSSEVGFVAGQRVELIAPDEDMDVVPTFTLLDNTFSNDTETIFDTNIGLLALEFEMDAEGFTVPDSSVGYPHLHNDWHWHKSNWHCHDRGLDGGCYVWAWHQHGFYWDLHGSEWHTHYTDPIVFGGTSIDVGPATDNSFDIAEWSDTSLYDQDRAPWALAGFSSSTGSPFPLSPQLPPTAIAGHEGAELEGSELTFTGEDSSDPNDDLLTYSWDFGDGSSSVDGMVVAHTYVDNGTYTAVLTVDDDHNDPVSVDHVVDVDNVAPTATAASSQIVFRNDLVLVSGTWADPAGIFDNAYGWAWDLDGDGGVDEVGTAPYGSAIGQVALFADEGIYELKFSVSDKDLASGDDMVVIEVLNKPPNCDDASPTVDSIWSPNRKFVPVGIEGFTDPEGDAVTAMITAVFQDEPVSVIGSGNTSPDGGGIGTDTAFVRAERSGSKKAGGNGRVYMISFTGDDGHGGECDGTVLVNVPYDQGKNSFAINDGVVYDSTAP